MMKNIDSNTIPKQKVLIVYIHGFMGKEESFHDFPEAINRDLQTRALHGHNYYYQNSENNGLNGSYTQNQPVAFKSIIFPSYETRGELSDAVKKFNSWLITRLSEEIQLCGYDEQVEIKILLVGHSMGGILACDSSFGLHAKLELVSAINIHNYEERRRRAGYFGTSTNENGHRGINANTDMSFEEQHSQLGQEKVLVNDRGVSCRIVGVIGLDTPFYGINHQALTESTVEKAQKIGSNIERGKSVGVEMVNEFRQFFSKDNKANTSINDTRGERKSSSLWGLKESLSGILSGKNNNESGNVGVGSRSIGTQQQDQVGVLSKGLQSDISNTSEKKGSFSFGGSSSGSDSIDRDINPTMNRSGSGSGTALKYTAAGLAVLGVVATATLAYKHRKKITNTSQFVNEHVGYASTLYNSKQMSERMQMVFSRINVVKFHCFYNELSQNGSGGISSYGNMDGAGNKRTFVKLPSGANSFERSCFTPIELTGSDAHVENTNGVVYSHMNMFDIRNQSRIAVLLEKLVVDKIYQMLNY